MIRRLVFSNFPHKSFVLPVQLSLRHTLKDKLAVLYTVHAVEQRQWLQLHRLLGLLLSPTHIHLLLLIIPYSHWHLHLLYHIQIPSLCFFVFISLILKMRGRILSLSNRLSSSTSIANLVLECHKSLLLHLLSFSLLRLLVIGSSDQSNQVIDIQIV